ncbi:MAG: alpha/beta hydrolase [Bacteroidota bacterium]
MQPDDLMIEYQLTGGENSEALLFVHGLGANHHQFEKQHDHFSENFTVLSVNLRGYGNSTMPQPASPADFTLAKMGEDIIKVLDTLAIEKVHYIGNSMGGNVGYELLKSYPKRITSFITFGTTAKLQKSEFTITLMRFMYQLMSSNVLAYLSSLAGRTEYAKSTIKQMMTQAPKSTILNTLPILANFDYLEVIKESTVPAMIIKGSKDVEINKELDSTVQAFEQRGNFQLKTIENAGHFANLDCPSLFNEVLGDFVKTTRLFDDIIARER